MTIAFSIRDEDVRTLRAHLFSGDGKESAALILCGSGTNPDNTRLMAREIILVDPEDAEIRTDISLSWATDKYLTPSLIERMDKQGLSLVTAHSHPTGLLAFSLKDNQNDAQLFPSVHGWFDDDRKHGALIMLRDGAMRGRCVDAHGQFIPIEKICVTGDCLRFYNDSSQEESQKKELGSGHRVKQTFGKGTFNLLRSLRIGIVGCSGTGSIVAELLARNCVGELVLVDSDQIEEKNLNRILNATSEDARSGTYKVNVLAQSIKSMGTDVSVKPLISKTSDKEAISALKTCDVIFGCVDSAEGRYHLDSLSVAYLIPYFDVGVRLDANGNGGINQAIAAVNYVQPGDESLMERGIYTGEQVRAEGLLRTAPDYYQEQREAGYLAEVGEDHPAVISLNMQASCLAVNDFLARIHGYRLDDNADFRIQSFSLTHGTYEYRKSQKDSEFFRKYLGQGDQCGLLKAF